MSRHHVLVVALATALIAGCATTTSEMLARPGGTFGPSSGPSYGLIRYAVSSSESDMRLRQQDAEMKMSNACSDHYRVVSQTSRGSLTTSPGGGGRRGLGSSVQSKDYVYIKFVCLK